ncbi:Alpha/Beta hydrolase protein [Obelidium mucronatum]|nr:Alpha/Beta hydrolase protein [Obelidium mucronatum]
MTTPPTLIDACCNVPAVSADYQSEGTTVHVLTPTTNDYYAPTPYTKTNKAVIVVHDAFGVNHPNVKQVADLLAQTLGFHVIVPDFYRSETLPREGGRDAIMAFLGKWDYDTVVRHDLVRVAKWLKETHGVDSVVVVGLCWGGKVVFRLGGDVGHVEGLEAVKGIATAHPSLLEVSFAEKLEVPVALLPSKDEDAKLMDDIFEAVQKNAKASKLSIHQRFDDMHHGWVGARGDYSNEENNRRATEALNIFASFFRKVLRDEVPVAAAEVKSACPTSGTRR